MYNYRRARDREIDRQTEDRERGREGGNLEGKIIGCLGENTKGVEGL